MNEVAIVRHWMGVAHAFGRQWIFFLINYHKV
jgi:hypothetical protein